MNSTRNPNQFVIARRHVAASLGMIALAFEMSCASSKTIAKTPPQSESTATSSALAPAPAKTPDDLLRARLDAVSLETEAFLTSRKTAAAMASMPPPSLRMGGTTVSGRLAPELIQRVVRANFSEFRRCYEGGLKKNPNLSGRVNVRFVIAKDGSVSNVGEKDSDLPDEAVKACIIRAFSSLKFPEPEGGIVTVVYPIMFSSAEDAANSRPNAPPATPPSPSPPLPPPTETPVATSGNGGNDTGPIVVIDGRSVRLDGAVVGDTQAILDANRLMKVDSLFEVAKARREQWKAIHPGKPFVGAAGLRVSPTTPLVVFKSVFQTLAFAGYPDIFVQSASDPEQILEIIAQVPGPPNPSAPAEPEPVLVVSVAQHDVALVWKRGATVISEERVAKGDSGFASTLCESWKNHHKQAEPDDSRRDAVVLHGDNALSWESMAMAARAAETCTREARQSNGRVEKKPVFWTIFSVR